MNKALFFTLTRLFLSPLLLAPLIALQVPTFITLMCYTLLAATDFFDGYYARKYKTVTPAGAFLDQFSDKIFLFSVIIAQVFTRQCPWWGALLLVIRELLVMGLREYGMQIGITLPVVFAAKVKTALQMILMALLLVDSIPLCIKILVGVATLISSYYSAFIYVQKVYHKGAV